MGWRLCFVLCCEEKDCEWEGLHVPVGKSKALKVGKGELESELAAIAQGLRNQEQGLCHPTPCCSMNSSKPSR